MAEFSPATREIRVRFPANAALTFGIVCVPSKENIVKRAGDSQETVQRFRSVAVITFA